MVLRYRRSDAKLEEVTPAARHAARDHDGRGVRRGVGAGHRRAAAAAVADRGLPAGGRADRAAHAGPQGGRVAGEPARRDRRGAADVRGRPALPRARPARGGPARDPGRPGAEHRGDAPGSRDRARLRLAGRLRPRAGHGALGGEHGGAAARAGGAQPHHDARRPRRDRLADRRGHPDRARAGGDPGAGAGACVRDAGRPRAEPRCRRGASRSPSWWRSWPWSSLGSAPLAESARVRGAAAVARALHAHDPGDRDRDRRRRPVLFGASMALGAFLAGMVVGQSPSASKPRADALPLRDAFCQAVLRVGRDAVRALVLLREPLRCWRRSRWS